MDIVEREPIRIAPQECKPVETMSDNDIIQAINECSCGCYACEVFPDCRYGQEAGRRGLLV